MLNIQNQNRQALAVIAMILIPCLALGYYVFYESIKTRIEDEMLKNTQLAKITAQYLDTYLRNIKFTLSGFNNRQLQLYNKSANLQTLQNYALRDDAESYFLLDAGGQELALYPASRGPLQIPGVILQKAVKEGITIEILNYGHDPVEIAVISAIKDKKGKPVAFAGAIISMEKVAREFANIKVSNNGYLIMINSIGQVLVHPNPQLLRQRIPLEKMKKDPIYRAATRGAAGAIEIEAPYDGKKKLFAYAPLREADWIVLLVEPETDLQVLITKNLTRNAVFFLLVIISVISLYQYLKISMERATEQEALRAEKLALVGQLAAGMAHEIRNPLTAVKGFLQMLMTGETHPKNRKFQEIMMSEIMRIEEIIKETLLLAKPQQTEETDFPLGPLLQQVISVLSGEAALSNIIFDLGIEGEPLVIRGNANHLKQALINIVKNAIEASDDGGVVTIKAYENGSRAIVEVIDKGPGIDKSILAKVGTPFFTTKENGTGLGLMVTHRIIDSMGGKLEIFSQPGQGTRVAISLPLAGI